MASHRRMSGSAIIAEGLAMRTIPEDTFRGDGATWTGAKEKLVLGPYDYLYERPGKDIRKTMIAAFNIWLKVPEDRLDIINKVVGMLHTASLLCV